jgi:hypothetical protein
MNNLKTLVISDTDIDSGLEYLPESLEQIFCSNRDYYSKEKDDETVGKCYLIKESLKKYEDEKEYSVGGGTDAFLYYNYKK